MLVGLGIAPVLAVMGKARMPRHQTLITWLHL
jgi:hypothetical protein